MTSTTHSSATPLSVSALSGLDARVGVPSYRREDVSVGIVHFGVGGFHRAHQAMYLDRLMNEGKAMDFGICGVGLLPGDARMRDALVEQDHLYTLVLKYADGRLEPRVIGSIVDYLFAPDDPEKVFGVLCAPSTRIVSLTVTEGGYNIDSVTGEFDRENPAILHDAAGGEAPVTFFGYLTEALRRRRDSGLDPFTVMCCDNIPGNGDNARNTLSAYAELVDPELATWIRERVAFPNSMVDRITPVTADTDRAVLAEEFGIADAWPVVCEDFTQWVLEDHFPTGRPVFEDAGAQLVADVEPYELMKLRLLNASHQALCYAGYLSGYRYAHEVCADPVFVEFLLGYMDNEGGVTLPPVPGVDLAEYKAELIRRFANPQVRDTVARLCAESSDRIPKWLLPVVRENLAADREIRRSVAVVASWARYDEALDEQGEPIQVVDRLAEELVAIAKTQGDNPLAFVENRKLFGDLVDDPRFATAYLDSLSSFHTVGAHATIESLNLELRG